MQGLDFVVNKKLNREITMHIKKFNSDNELISMTTSTNDQGQVSLDHLILYFSYERVGNF